MAALQCEHKGRTLLSAMDGSFWQFLQFGAGALTTSAVNTGMPAAAEAAAATLAALVGGQAAAEGAQPSDSKATRRSAGDPSQGSGTPTNLAHCNCPSG